MTFRLMILILLAMLLSPVQAQEREEREQRDERDGRRDFRDRWRSSRGDSSRTFERGESGARTYDRSDAGSRSPDAPAAAGFYERYGVLTESNMFLRERRAATTAPATQPSEPPPTPEQIMVLTGIVLEDNGFRAYFENLREGRIVRVAPGDSIATGQIAEIFIDAVAYLSGDDQPRWIEIGQDLTGTTSSATAAGTSSSSEPAAPTTSFAPEVDPSTLSPADQMRLRRQRELQR